MKAAVSESSFVFFRSAIGNKEEAEITYYHIARSGHYSIENAKKLIDYQPQYSTRETVEISIQSYIDRGIITIE